VRIPAGDVVVGDIVLLYEGDVVPADGVLLSGISLSTGQDFGSGVCVTAFPPVQSSHA
jgi:magnesium-transporting ATPase (P-type)